MEISASDFKAHCLALIERVAQTHEEIVITKRGSPVVKLVSVPERAPGDVFGCLAGSITYAGDLVSPIGEAWEADGNLSRADPGCGSS